MADRHEALVLEGQHLRRRQPHRAPGGQAPDDVEMLGWYEQGAPSIAQTAEGWSPNEAPPVRLVAKRPVGGRGGQ